MSVGFNFHVYFIAFKVQWICPPSEQLKFMVPSEPCVTVIVPELHLHFIAYEYDANDNPITAVNVVINTFKVFIIFPLFISN